LRFVDGVSEEIKQEITAFFLEVEGQRQKGIPFATNDQDISAQSLGFTNYADYMASKKWERIRRRVLKRDCRRCLCCSGTASQMYVHHRSYTQKVLAGEDDTQLASICEGCHEFIHWDESGKYRDARAADPVLVQGRRNSDFLIPNGALLNELEYPPEWPRMSALQRNGWQRECDRLRNLLQTAKKRGNKSALTK